MAEKKETSSSKVRRRRHGYRGYGSGFDRGFGGTVRWGRGFSGIGSPGESGAMTLPHAGMFETLGPYAGRAPMGYARSDERIREDICDELTRRPDIDPGRLAVTVTNGGEVTLEGAVEDLESRRLADEIATRCIGVRQVHNALRVEPGSKKKS